MNTQYYSGNVLINIWDNQGTSFNSDLRNEEKSDKSYLTVSCVTIAGEQNKRGYAMLSTLTISQAAGERDSLLISSWV